MENRSHAIVAGIFVLLMATATALAVWYFSGQRERTDTYLLQTHKNVNGLNLQAQVLYRGIPAGKVESIAPDSQDARLILVRIELDSRYRLTRATKAQLGFKGVTGLAYVQLDDDGSSREFLDTAASTPPRIELKPMLLDTLGDKAGEIVNQVAELATRLNRVLDDKNTKHLASTLENISSASAAMKQAPQVVASLREALSPANLQRLNSILAHVEKTAGEAAPLTKEMRDMVKAMSALSTRLDRVVGDTGNKFSGSTLPQLDALMKELGANSRQISHLLDTLEDSPQALIFGKREVPPGPGETGFVAPAATEK